LDADLAAAGKAAHQNELAGGLVGGLGRWRQAMLRSALDEATAILD
jgi:hypothetical protein